MNIGAPIEKKQKIILVCLDFRDKVISKLQSKEPTSFSCGKSVEEYPGISSSLVYNLEE